MKTPISVSLATTALFLFTSLSSVAVPTPAINRVITARSVSTPPDSQYYGPPNIIPRGMADLAALSTSEVLDTVYYRRATEGHDQEQQKKLEEKIEKENKEILDQIATQDQDFLNILVKTGPTSAETYQALANLFEYVLAILRTRVPAHPTLKEPVEKYLRSYHKSLPCSSENIIMKFKCLADNADTMAHEKFHVTPLNEKEISGFVQASIVMRWNVVQELSLHLHDPEGQKMYHDAIKNEKEYLRKVAKDPEDPLYGPVCGLAASYLTSPRHFNDREWKSKLCPPLQGQSHFPVTSHPEALVQTPSEHSESQPSTSTMAQDIVCPQHIHDYIVVGHYTLLNLEAYPDSSDRYRPEYVRATDSTASPNFARRPAVGAPAINGVITARSESTLYNPQDYGPPNTSGFMDVQVQVVSLKNFDPRSRGVPDLATRTFAGEVRSDTVDYRRTVGLEGSHQEVIEQLKNQESDFNSFRAAVAAATPGASLVKLHQKLARHLQYILGILRTRVPDDSRLREPVKRSLEQYLHTLPNPETTIERRLESFARRMELLAHDKFRSNPLRTPPIQKEITTLLKTGIVMRWNRVQELSLHRHELPDGQLKYAAVIKEERAYLKQVVQDPNDAFFGPVCDFARSYLTSEYSLDDQER
ncbi:hypothetical protein H0H93_006643, partial [Arthromyces matolae]